MQLLWSNNTQNFMKAIPPPGLCYESPSIPDLPPGLASPSHARHEHLALPRLVFESSCASSYLQPRCAFKDVLWPHMQLVGCRTVTSKLRAVSSQCEAGTSVHHLISCSRVRHSNMSGLVQVSWPGHPSEPQRCHRS